MADEDNVAYVSDEDESVSSLRSDSVIEGFSESILGEFKERTESSSTVESEIDIVKFKERLMETPSFFQERNGRLHNGVTKVTPKINVLQSKESRVQHHTVNARIPVLQEDEIEIPNDGCLYKFNVAKMMTFFRHLGIEERLIAYMEKINIDGKKFSKLRDSDLETLRIMSPIIVFFRNKSRKKRLSFML